MSAWERSGNPPEILRITVAIDSRRYPELVAHLWSQPFRGLSAYIRDVLINALVERKEPVSAEQMQQALQGMRDAAERMEAAARRLEELHARAAAIPSLSGPPVQPTAAPGQQPLSEAARRLADTF